MKLQTYNNLEEKVDYFGDFNIIDTKNQFDDWYNNLSKSYIFRGVHEAKYKQFTSLQRYYIENRIHNTKPMKEFVKEEINEISKINNGLLPDYYYHLNVNPNDFLYLSFLQHYSAPTPLLDFTHDINVALYFATENVPYGNENDDIDNYISIYFIENNDNLFNIDAAKTIADKYIKNTLTQKTETENIETENTGKKKLYEKMSNINEYISLKYLTNNLSYISNDYKYNRQENLDYDLGIWKLSQKVREYRYKQNAEQKNNDSILKILTNYFTKYVQITNLNLVAQKRCFILYFPDAINISLEEYLKDKDIKLHCINIHKSLVDHIISKIKLKQNDIYPEQYLIAKDAYIQTKKHIDNLVNQIL